MSDTTTSELEKKELLKKMWDTERDLLPEFLVSLNKAQLDYLVNNFKWDPQDTWGMDPYLRREILCAAATKVAHATEPN